MITTSIIIPTLLGDQSLRDCIQSLQDYTDLVGVEVIVVANGCSPTVKLYLETLPHPFQYIWYNDPLGFSQAVNKGIQESCGDYIVILNDDCKLLSQERNTWIQQLKIPFQDDERVGVVGPHALVDPITNYAFVPYYCVMLRREVLEKVGLLDENFAMGGCEDIDHCIRLQKAGYEAFALPKIEKEPQNKNYALGTFPLYHEGEHTVIPYFKDKQNDWEAIFSNNQYYLKAKWVDKLLSTPPRIPQLMSRKTIEKTKEALQEVLNSPSTRPFDAEMVFPSPFRLHLGCGDMILPGYINADKYNSKAEQSWDAVALPLPSNVVDEIYTSHLIEHFDFHQGQEVLKEWKRVLKKEGILILETPDLLASCKKFVASDEQGRVNLYSHFFSEPWIPGQIHKFLYTPIQMRWTLEQLGFKEIHQERALRYTDKEDICMKFVCRKG